MIVYQKEREFFNSIRHNPPNEWAFGYPFGPAVSLVQIANNIPEALDNYGEHKYCLYKVIVQTSKYIHDCFGIILIPSKSSR